ncbi:cation diffusion facilitator family transporter [Stakelama saccharophila]|uniref:Cation diffusion facilitator family transporter n=1 Tax=Stakelama saccharophila TaxID=3075605 RepID=A0ABZ0BB06_9SPHN|nr:cation diffusion facilitator family transporter [Stakelama sp. W311]WNO53499.1 cation diffusion facilitator family transporter [Stakelama sp. W311]
MGGHHHHGHDHGHSHAGHGHAPASFGTAFAVGIGLNVIFVVIEAAYGILSNSLALLADAGHNLSDVFGLVIAWVALLVAKKAPTWRYTYGLQGSSILAALANGVFLMLAAGAIAWQAVLRFSDPEPVAGNTVMIVAAIGIAINTGTALMFMRGRKGDINIQGAFLHMAADAAVSAGVVLAGLAIRYTGWNWLDPVTSLLIVAVIVWSTWGLLREAFAMSLNAVPSGIDAKAVEEHLAQIDCVTAVHDLHIWAMSTTDTALTAHLVVPAEHDRDAFLHDVAADLHEHFGIDHTTLQIERDPKACALEPADVV